MKILSIIKKGGENRPDSLKIKDWLIFDTVALLEAFDTPGSIDDSAFPGKERMTLAAKLDLHFFLGRPQRNDIAAGTDYLGIGIINGMYFFLHIN
jgi:hypothetical protein